MIKRLLPLLLLTTACAGGEGDESPGTFSASFSDTNTNTTSPTGDGDGDPMTGDGDGDPTTTTTTTTTGDGDGDMSGDGDGDGDMSGDGDGDGDADPCPVICDGMVDSTPNTCDAPYIIGRTPAKEGFFYGGSTQSATNEDTENCGPHSNPDNLDTGRDHFFRIWLVEGDTIIIEQDPTGWDARLKVHDEADCVGNAKECTTEVDPAMIEYEAPKTDWFTIVADGVSVGLGDHGDYFLNVDLLPGAGIDECSCP